MTLIEPLGADTLITVKAQTHKLIVRVIGASALRLGEQVGLTWDPKDHHLFDGVSGKAMT